MGIRSLKIKAKNTIKSFNFQKMNLPKRNQIPIVLIALPPYHRINKIKKKYKFKQTLQMCKDNKAKKTLIVLM